MASSHEDSADEKNQKPIPLPRKMPSSKEKLLAVDITESNIKSVTVADNVVNESITYHIHVHHHGSSPINDQFADLSSTEAQLPATSSEIISDQSPLKKKLKAAPLELESSITGIPGSEKWIPVGEGTGITYNSKSRLRKGSNVFLAKKTGVVDEEIVVKFVTECVKDNEREVQHLIDVRESENVVKYIESGRCEFNHDEAIYIAMERCETKPLSDRIGEKIPYEKRKEYVHSIAKGLKHLKENHIIHRDLKPQNILFKKGSAVLSDFGLSKKHPENRSNTVNSKDNVGTDGWRAHETADTGGELSYETDIFSAGLLFYFILTNGKHPYGANKVHRQTYIDIGKEPDLQDIYETPDGTIAFDLIGSMLSRDPEERPSIELVLKHPFFFDAKERLNFLSTAHKTVVYMKNLKKTIKTGLDLNSSEGERYGAEIAKETENWNGEKLKLTKDEKAAIESNFKQKGVNETVTYDAMMKKTKGRGGTVAHLLRFIWNRDTHALEDNLKQTIDMTNEQSLKFFSDRFPHLFIYVFSRFRSYYFGKNKSDRDFYPVMAKYFESN